MLQVSVQFLDLLCCEQLKWSEQASKFGVNDRLGYAEVTQATCDTSIFLLCERLVATKHDRVQYVGGPDAYRYLAKCYVITYFTTVRLP